MSMLYLRNKPIGAVSGGGSGGGHVIENASGTELAQRDTLKFGGYLQATDDSTNEKSVVSDAPSEVEYSVWQTMTDTQKAGKKWIIKNVPKTGGTPTDNSVSVTADGVKTYATLLNELYALIDANKITRNSIAVLDLINYKRVLGVTYISSSRLDFSCSTASSSTKLLCDVFSLNSTDSTYRQKEESTTVDDRSANIPTSGTTITLYYNIIASAGVGDITADDVSYESGTVADALDGLKAQMFGTAENVSYSADTQSNFTLTGVVCKRCGDEIFFSCSVKVISNPSGWIKVATITLPNGTFQPIDIRDSYKWTDVASQYALGAMAIASAGGSDVYLYYRGGSTGDGIITMQMRIPIAVN